ncbi:MAG: GTP-binding protein, partial [Thiohalocapsa sp.]
SLRKGTLDGTLFPCFGGSALRNFGVQPVMDAAVDLLPAPLDRPPALALLPEGGSEEIALGGKGPLTALVFKVQMWDGRRHCFTRVYRNRLTPGDKVSFLTSDGRTVTEQVARIFDTDAGRKTRLNHADPGQIVLLAGLRHASTGDTLCAPGHLLTLERIDQREPVLSLAIEPAAGADESKLVEALDKLVQEDPSLQVADDPETGQRLLRGMGELHLQIIIERLEREFHLQVRSGRPAVAVRETITRPAAADVLYARPESPDGKQSELRAQVQLRVVPRARGDGNDIAAVPRVSPEGVEMRREQLAAVLDAISGSLTAGPEQGAPMQDIAVQLIEVELFGPASTSDALAAATSQALAKAIADAGPAALHPVMRVEVIVPEDNLGVVLGDLQQRHSLIQATDSRDGVAAIACEVALQGLLGYTTELRSMTQGRGQFTMQFERFDVV